MKKNNEIVHGMILNEFDNKAMGYKAINTIFKTKISALMICSTIYYFKKIKYTLLKENRKNYSSQSAMRTSIYNNINYYIYTRKKSALFTLLDDEYTLFIVCIIISTKNFLDTVYTNLSWSDISNISLQRLNQAERIALEAIEYSVFIPKNEIEDIMEKIQKQKESDDCKDGNKTLKRIVDGIKTFTCMD